jgi:asparagine N-glycosylation enzyme membrane subunit Stt3
MTGGSTPAIEAGPGFPRLAVGLAWVCSSLAVGVLGWLLFAISERNPDRLAGLVLLGLALLGLVAAGAVVSNRRRALTLTFSLAASGAFVITGIAAVVIVAAQGDSFAGDLLLIGGIPVVGGMVSGVLGLRARSMAG